MKRGRVRRAMGTVIGAAVVTGLAGAAAGQVNWVQRATTGPSIRDGHRMAYDAARGVTTLFAGYNTNLGNLQDTWTWNGAWTLRATGGPDVRDDHAMAYDVVRGVVVMF